MRQTCNFPITPSNTYQPKGNSSPRTQPRPFARKKNPPLIKQFSSQTTSHHNPLPAFLKSPRTSWLPSSSSSPSSSTTDFEEANEHVGYISSFLAAHYPGNFFFRRQWGEDLANERFIHDDYFNYRVVASCGLLLLLPNVSWTRACALHVVFSVLFISVAKFLPNDAKSYATRSF